MADVAAEAKPPEQPGVVRRLHDGPLLLQRVVPLVVIFPVLPLPSPMGYGGKGGWASYSGFDFNYGGFGKGYGKGVFFGKGAGKDFFRPKSVKGLVRSIQQMKLQPGSGRWENDEGALFVSGLPDDTDDVDMYAIFSPFGAIAPRGCCAMKDKETKKPMGIGFVNFLEPSAAQDAIKKLDGLMMSDGSLLRVKKKGPPKPKEDNESAPAGSTAAPQETRL